jgi:hypothetical protein
MSKNTKCKDYEVGYGKPPRATRFKPGNCANPNGRPVGSKSFKTLIDEELAEEIIVPVQGVPVKITKKKALAKRAVNKALTEGDYKLLKELGGFAEPEAATPTEIEVSLVLDESHPDY